ncbi:hypothetical protein ALT1545_340020 [Alteromonas macleodii]
MDFVTAGRPNSSSVKKTIPVDIYARYLQAILNDVLYDDIKL